MALDESALSALLDAFRTGDGVDLIRDAVRLVLQELIETEASGVIGAEPHCAANDQLVRYTRVDAGRYAGRCEFVGVDEAGIGRSAKIHRAVGPDGDGGPR